MTWRKDHPELDPHVSELGGFDVTALSVEELGREGVLTGRTVFARAGEAEFWKTHSEFLADVRPDWDLEDRAYARADTARHVSDVRARAAALEADGKGEEGEALRQAALAGLRLLRTFPCVGALRILSRIGRVREVSCDVCGETFGVSEPRRPKGPRTAGFGESAKPEPDWF